MLEIQKVSKRYGAVQALSDVTFPVGPGEVVGLFGENGSGKTTLMKSILGLQSFKGIILLGGQPVTRSNANRLSFASTEHSCFPFLTAADHEAYYAKHFPKFRRERYVMLTKFFEIPLNRPIGNLSYGIQSQMEVILALCQGAEYILMDEPFVNYDLLNREDFYKIILGLLEPDETILLSTHLIEEVEGFINRALLIHEGKLVDDISTETIEASGTSLIDFVKKTYGYQSDRVGQALAEITGDIG